MFLAAREGECREEDGGTDGRSFSDPAIANLDLPFRTSFSLLSRGWGPLVPPFIHVNLSRCKAVS